MSPTSTAPTADCGNESTTTVEEHLHGGVRRLFATLPATNSLTSPGALPQGWMPVHIQPTPPQSTTSTCVLFNGHTWALATWAGRHASWIETPQASEGYTLAPARTGHLEVRLVAASLGGLLDQMRASAHTSLRHPWAHLMANLVGPLLNPRDPIGCLMRLGSSRGLKLPTGCYDPLFGVPQDAPESDDILVGS